MHHITHTHTVHSHGNKYANSVGSFVFGAAYHFLSLFLALSRSKFSISIYSDLIVNRIFYVNVSLFSIFRLRDAYVTYVINM